jgi:hypothetical protein
MGIDCPLGDKTSLRTNVSADTAVLGFARRVISLFARRRVATMEATEVAVLAFRVRPCHRARRKDSFRGVVCIMAVFR